jgi:hypothetical protein
VNACERAYRLALLAYPGEYRAARGEEILSTLMDGSGRRRLPRAREIAALVRDGGRRRLGMRPLSRVAAWRSGALLGAYLLATANLAVALLGNIQEQRLGQTLDFGVQGFGPRIEVLGLVTDPWFLGFTATAAGIVLALAAGRYRTATLLATAGLILQVQEFVSTPGTHVPGGHYAVYAWTNASSLPRDPSHWLAAGLLLPLLIVAAGSRPARPLRHGIPLALAVVAAAALMAFATSHAWGGFVILLGPLAALTLVSLMVAPGDPRPAIACLPLLAVAAPMAWTYVVGDSTTPVRHGMLLLVALPVAMALLAWMALRATRADAPGSGGNRRDS